MNGEIHILYTGQNMILWLYKTKTHKPVEIAVIHNK